MPIALNNPYLQQVYRNLPRILALYDNDSSSRTYGLGDRFYWAWKLIDFPNGTYQAAVSGLALLIKHELYPKSFKKERLLQRIESMMLGLQTIIAKNGSLDEALPNEGSFCVTGLVAADVLFAAELLKNEIPPQQYRLWISIAKPLIHFLYQQDEYHGLISNHLATCALALVRWSLSCPEESKRAEERAHYFISKIIANQSSEGWFKEYDSADAGYQTWCIASLCVIAQLKPEWNLHVNIAHSLEFLKYAAHPDGSFGGNYGSRMTRFVFPSGFEALSSLDNNARSLAHFFRSSIALHSCVTLDAIDNGNLIPLFNDYIAAGIACQQNQSLENDSKAGKLPFEIETDAYFSDSGWYINSSRHSYTVLNIKKSGMGLRVFKNGASLQIINPPCVQLNKGPLIAGGFYHHQVNLATTENGIEFDCALQKLSRPLPSIFNFLILRVLSLTLFRSLTLGNRIKKILANYLIHKKKKAALIIKRQINLKGDLSINDKIPDSYRNLEIHNFKPIHMASQGYWQTSDEK